MPSSLKIASYLLATVALTSCEKHAGEKANLPQETPKLESKSEAAPEAAPTQSAATPGPAQPIAAAKPAETSAAPAQTEEKFAARLIGEVQAARKAEMSFKVAGYLEKILAREGQMVKKGEVLAILEPRDFQLRADQANARYELAKVTFKNAQKELDREKQLKSEKVATEASFDRSMTAFEQARLNELVASLDFTQARRSLEDTKLLAPYDCVVAERFKDEREFIKDGTAMFKIYDLEVPEIKLEAAERYAGQFKVGSSLEVAVPAAQFSGPATITRIVPVISEKSRTFTIYARVTDKAIRLAPGSYAEATVK